MPTKAFANTEVQGCLTRCWDNSQYVATCNVPNEAACLCEDSQFQNVSKPQPNNLRVCLTKSYEGCPPMPLFSMSNDTIRLGPPLRLIDLFRLQCGHLRRVSTTDPPPRSAQARNPSHRCRIHPCFRIGRALCAPSLGQWLSLSPDTNRSYYFDDHSSATC